MTVSSPGREVCAKTRKKNRDRAGRGEIGRSEISGGGGGEVTGDSQARNKPVRAGREKTVWIRKPLAVATRRRVRTVYLYGIPIPYGVVLSDDPRAEGEDLSGGDKSIKQKRRADAPTTQ